MTWPMIVAKHVLVVTAAPQTLYCKQSRERDECPEYIYIEQPAPLTSRHLAPSPSTITAMMPSLSYHRLLTNARKLVPFLPPKPISLRMAKEQDASLLYSRLPPELRQMIWETYFRGHAVHVILHVSSKRLRGKECLTWETWDPDTNFKRGPHSVPCREAEIQCDHISLVLTCKNMYISCLICSLPPTNLSY